MKETEQNTYLSVSLASEIKNGFGGIKCSRPARPTKKYLIMAQITYIAEYSFDYEEVQCFFFKSPKNAQEWADNNEEYENMFEFGEDIETDSANYACDASH